MALRNNGVNTHPMRSRSDNSETSPNNPVGALRRAVCAISALIVIVSCGCRSREVWQETVGDDTAHIDYIARRLDCPTAEIHPAAFAEAPVTIRHRKDLDAIRYRDSTLDEILRIALQNSDVLRELGGTVLRNPASIHSRFTNGLVVTNPRFSPEAALSAFDAQLSASAFFNNNRQLANNPFFSGGANPFIQDLHEYTVELSKNTATGSTLALRSVSTFDGNNAPSNTFPNAWDTYLEGEIRKPLLQGGGLQFNRIAGPGSTAGVYNGLLIAKANSDMSQSEFEIAVRNYVNDVTNAYWDLYFAYRNLDARSQGMKRALESWNVISARQKSEIETGASEALAREQYYRFKADVDEAISGRVTLGTRTGNGSTGGTLEAAGGVQTTERRLRLLIGLTITDGELIRPNDEPTEADIVFDWYNVQQDALQLRSELRRQQVLVRKREMELLAARNFLNPRLDAVARYRFRGFGDDLINTDGVNNGTAPASALGHLANGDFQEWLLGFEYEVPLGYRRGHLAVQNAELQLSRERIIHREQQREIVHNLSNAISDASRAYEACQNSLNRYHAARELLDAYDAQGESGRDVDVDHLLDAQRRVVEAELRYYRSRTEYALALKNVHLEKGSLLSYHDLHIFNHQPHTSVAPMEEPDATRETAPGDTNDADPEEVAAPKQDAA